VIMDWNEDYNKAYNCIYFNDPKVVDSFHRVTVRNRFEELTHFVIWVERHKRAYGD
jgi:hypothetical protein